MRKQLTVLLFLFLVAAILSGCDGNTSPDLAPAKPPGNPTFCERDEEGRLYLYVKNQGNAPASSSAVEVEFFITPGATQKIRAQGVTGPLGVGETSSSTIYVDIPPGCFNPDCNFNITVDILDEVQEANEQNNTVEASCLG